MSKGTTVRMWRRSLIVLIILIGGGFGVSAFRLVQLQIVQGESIQRMAMEQQLRDVKINAQRGTIYDRNMKPLAQSATVWTVMLEPAYLKDEKKREIVSKGLSEILKIDQEEILTKAKKRASDVIIKRKIESDLKDRIMLFQKEKKIRSGIRLIEDYKRYYPYGCFASSVIGFTGADSQGLAGLENYYDKELKGESGRLVAAKNAVGTDMPFEHEQLIAARNGYNLVLSIDEGVQHSLEKYLEEGRINSKAINGATAVMMDVNTGDILGMAIKKDFDLNAPFDIMDEETKTAIDSLAENERSKAKNEALQKQWRNKSVSDTYMPGSTFKILTSSMGLEENEVNENSPFHCNGSVVPFAGARAVHCHKRTGHGSQTFLEAVCHSCNPAFIALGQRLGAERFYKYYSSFGFTQRTGIDLPGEARGIFFSQDGSMAPMDLVVASFGQNFSITPIQMITAVAAAVNGGKLVKPHVVKQIIDDSGNIIKAADTTVKRQVVSQETSKRICSMLQTNVEVGAAKNAYVAGYRIGGKTGTSEKIGQSGPGGKDYIASFCGFAPSEAPKVALLVFYDTPKGTSYYGSMVAAPVFAKIMQDVLPYLGVEKKYNEKELTQLDIPTPFLVGSKLTEAKLKLQEAGLKPVVRGSGEAVISQIPETGVGIPKGGTVVLYTDSNTEEQKVAVPNFVGLTISNANKLAASLGLNMSISGAAEAMGEVVSSSQSIAEGTQVRPGTVIIIKFVQKGTAD